MVIFTDTRLSAGVSLGSVKPKSSVVSVIGVSSTVVSVVLVPCGASATELTVTVKLNVEMSPSLLVR